MRNASTFFQPRTTPEQNKAIVLEAFDTLFNKRDYAAAESFWSPKYIQHSAHIAPGREGLFALIRSSPDALRYENQLIDAEGAYVMAHGRFTGTGRPAAWIAADVVRFEDGLLKEHWDVLQDEATKAQVQRLSRSILISAVNAAAVCHLVVRRSYWDPDFCSTTTKGRK